jgi:secreted protein with Ig-like and vWFA domain
VFVQWIVALVSIMEAEELQVHASPLVASLSRFMEDGPTASILKTSLRGNVLVSSKANLETRDIADEGLKLIQAKLGTTGYLEISSAVRQEALGRREDRKIKRSLEAVTDPEKAAQKKIHQHKKVIHQC